MRQDKTHRRFRVRVASTGYALDQWLSQRQGVSEIKMEASTAEFSIDASDAEVATLLRDAINAGAPICALEELTETLEQLYSRLSPGEVM